MTAVDLQPRGPVHLLDVPMHLRASAQHAGAAWNKSLRSYAYRGDALPSDLRHFASAPFSLERYRETELNGVLDPIVTSDGTYTLRPHQVVAARAIVDARDRGRPGFVLADDVGLGKTLTIISAIQEMYDVDTALIVCPIYCIPNWRRSIAAMGDLGKRFVVINYDRLKRLMEVPDAIGPATAAGARRGSPKRRVASLKGVVRFGSAEAFDVVVWDECQRLRNRDSARSGLAAKLTAQAAFAIWASATTGQSPLELEYLAPLLCPTASPASAKPDYIGWCQSVGIAVSRGARGRPVWRGAQDDDEAKAVRQRDLTTMRDVLFHGPRPFGLRRTPEDIAGWPSISRSLVPVELAPDEAEAYRLAWHVFRDRLRLGGGRGVRARNVLTEQLRFRQKASLLRVSQTCDLVDDLLGTGRQIAVSVAFHETLQAIRDDLSARGARIVELHGRQPPSLNEANRLDFQRGRADVVLYTPVDALSLHQGEHNDAIRANVIHDIRWSGIDMKQVEGRTHRDGKHSDIHWMLAVGTVDMDIARVVLRRIDAMATMHGEDDDLEALYDDLLAA